MAIISFGKVNKKILVAIFGGLARLIYKFVINLNPKFISVVYNPFLLSIYTEIGMILAFIPFLILKSRIREQKNNSITKYTKKQIQKHKLLIEYEHYDIYKSTKWDKFKLIIISTIFDFLQTLLIYIFCMYCVYNLWIFDIIFISLFSYLILKAKLYKHQYISMIVIIILGFGLNIIEYFKSEEQVKIKPVEIFIKFIAEIFFCLNVVVNKHNMEKNFCTSYEICIWEGVINLILFVISLSIINSIGATIAGIKYPNNIYEYRNNFDKNDLYVIILVIVVSCVYNLLVIVTCEIFTPCHVLILLIINECNYYLKMNKNKILNFIGFLILLLIFFMFLFFIEVIELNLFGISINTKKNIGIRANDDKEMYIGEIDLSFDENDIENEKILDEEDEGKTKVEMKKMD